MREQRTDRATGTIGAMIVLLSGALLLAASAYAGSPAPARTRNNRAAIIDLTNGADRALLIGGWTGQGWVEDRKFQSRVYGGERYHLYGLAAREGEATGGKPILSEASGSAWQIEIKSPPKSGKGLIGLTGAWNALPRRPSIITDFAPYRSVLASVLKQHGLQKAPVLITGGIRIDLDGNGVEEEVISATSPRLARDAGEALMRSEKNDYSVVLLRSRSGGRSGGRSVTTVLPGAYWHTPDSTVMISEIGGALDLNGDGRLEIVVRVSYYEGGGARVFEFARGRARQVLEAIDGA